MSWLRRLGKVLENALVCKFPSHECCCPEAHRSGEAKVVGEAEEGEEVAWSEALGGRFRQSQQPSLFRDTLRKIIEAEDVEYKKLTTAA